MSAADFLYPFLSGSSGVSEAELLEQVQHSTREKFREVCRLRRLALTSQSEELVRAAEALQAAFAAGGRLFAFGNGGSATDAADLVADLARQGHPALSLTSESAVLTALANDVGFENVFVRQLRALAGPGDVALGISTSGGSRNLIAALEAAHQLGLLTIGLAGYEGGQMAEMKQAGGLDHLFTVSSQDIPRIQEVQATLYHMLLSLSG